MTSTQNTRVMGYFSSSGGTRMGSRLPWRSWIVLASLLLLTCALCISPLQAWVWKHLKWAMETIVDWIRRKITFIGAGEENLVSYIILMAFFVLLGSIMFGFARYRRRRVRTVLSYVENAVRLNLPLPEFLIASGAGEGWLVRKRLKKLVGQIQKGEPLGIALAISVPEMSDRVLKLIIAAEKSGHLAQTLHRECNPQALTRDAIAGERQPKYYAAIVMAFMLIVLYYFFIAVLPKFWEIFRDFKVEAPTSTKIVAKVGNFIFDGSLFFLPLFLLGTARIWLEIFAPGDRYIIPLRSFLQRIAWHIPGLRMVTQSRNLADAFSILADGISAGKPLPDALAIASEGIDNVVLTRRFEYMQGVIARGGSLASAARIAQLPPRTIELLAAGEAAGTLAETCRYLSQFYAGRFLRAIHLKNAVVRPLVIVLLGCVVGMITVGLFSPLAALIEKALDETRLL